MPFNVALSGLRAASTDLEVTGNNVANASTTGFKKSSVQFGDLYAGSFLSGSINQIRSGVRVQTISQNFGQGSISVTANSRSEEHTSELQSRLHVVCRLLLGKKNISTWCYRAGQRWAV